MATTKILVTGASGQLARSIIETILERNDPRIHLVLGTRDVAKVADLVARGATAVLVDFDVPELLPAAFAGIDRVVIVSTDAPSKGHDGMDQHLAAIRAAVDAKVKHILYTSIPDPLNSVITFAPAHAAAEKAIVESGVPFTILRVNWWNENLYRILGGAIARGGTWTTSNGEGRMAVVSRPQVGRAVGNAALAAPEYANRIFTLRGPERVTNGELAAKATEVLGKTVTLNVVTDEQLAAGIKAAVGLPDHMIATLVSFEAAARRGEFDGSADDLAALLGPLEQPSTVRSFLKANSAAF